MNSSPPLPFQLPTLADIDAEIARRSMLDWVPWLSPGYQRPTWLAPLCESIDLALAGKPQMVVCHAPPQHTKTDTVLHAIAKGLSERPELMFGYVTNIDRLTRRKSRRARALAMRAGVQLATTGVNDWTTVQGGGLLATSMRGPLTGFSKIDVLFIDDPYRNRLDAESPAHREANEDWFEDVATTRLWTQSSCFVFHTRWHPNDLAGYCIKQGWRYIRLPALSDDGKALWPEGPWPKERLEDKQRRRPYTFESLFQGNPRPRGATVFGPATTYAALPKAHRAAFGVDLSYSAKTSSDYSAVVKMVRWEGITYVVHAERHQVRAPVFRKICRRLHIKERSAPWRWYGASTEEGTANLMAAGKRGVPVEYVAASSRGDKLTRAQNFAEAWNAGLVQVPADAPWLEEFLDELQAFTGVGEEEDDQVDAAVAAFDLLDEADDDKVPEKPKAPAPTGLRALDL